MGSSQLAQFLGKKQGWGYMNLGWNVVPDKRHLTERAYFLGPTMDIACPSYQASWRQTALQIAQTCAMSDKWHSDFYPESSREPVQFARQ